MNPKLTSFPGHPYPFGPSHNGDQINFALFARYASKVTLLIFLPNIRSGHTSYTLDTSTNKTGNIWHIALAGIPPGTLYGYQVNGSINSAKYSCTPGTVLLDPYAKRISGTENWGKRSSNKPILGALDELAFDWQGDRQLKIPLEESIIYEMHIRGFTRNKNSAVQHPGTYQGLIEKIPYLTKLGITAVELLPIHEFDETEIKFTGPGSQKPLRNFWGYNSFNYFSPKAGYAAFNKAGQHVNEFKSLVQSLHRAGIEIILDVVFNHTGEGDASGPCLSFRGIDNSTYYLLDSEGQYSNYTGCGNTVNCNHPVVREFIIDCLRYWVTEMHIDGFRFDLASIFSRDQSGQVLDNPPLVEQIATDPILADTKIIAEAWDAAGLYQVGSFSNNSRWAEWNGRFRDDVRSFMCGHNGTVTTLATRIAGSSDLFQKSQRPPSSSINFITSHDGFTLYDLVSYSNKRNLANGENSRDGENHNISWNSGKEGPTKSLQIQQLRQRRMKTMATILLLSQGTPMLLAGDEFCRTQKGNNNAYCQDNSISWLDWSLAEKNKEMIRFFTYLIRLRKTHSVFRRKDFFASPSPGHPADILWQGKKRGLEDWSETNCLLCFFLNGKSSGDPNNFFIALNSGETAQSVEVPAPKQKGKWSCIIDTARTSPDDITEQKHASPLLEYTILVESMAAVVLIA